MSGSLLVIAAPSGAGKSSLVNALVEHDANLVVSISFTTRGLRPGESQGREYHFVSRETFMAMRERGEFLESAEVHGNFYGTSRKWIEAEMRGGRDIVLEIDCQGAAQIRSRFPDVISVFVLPPSRTELERRLRDRGTDSEAEIARRMKNADEEMQRAGEFDYAIINASFSDAQKALQAIVLAARLRFRQVAGREPDVFLELGISR